MWEGVSGQARVWLPGTSVGSSRRDARYPVPCRVPWTRVAQRRATDNQRIAGTERACQFESFRLGTEVPAPINRVASVTFVPRTANARAARFKAPFPP